MSESGEDPLIKLAYLKRITYGGLEAEPPAAGGYGGLGAKLGDLLYFSKKIAILMPLNHILHVFRAI